MLTVIALWLRIAPFNPPSLWLDDLWVITPSRAQSPSDAIDMMVTAPGFSVLANVLPWLVGPESWAAQLLPLVAGVLAPAVAIVVVRWMGWGWPGAGLAATVMAVAPEHLIYSSRVKQYTLEALIGLVLVGVAWRVVERRSSPWVMAGLAAGATFLSGSAGVFAGAIVAAACALVLGDDPRRAKELMRPAVAYGTFAVAWWALYLRSNVPEGLRQFWSDAFITVDDGPRALLLDLRGSLGRMADGFLPVGPAWLWLTAAACVLAIAMPRLLVLVAAPVIAAVALALFHQAPLGVGRTDIYLLPVAALALGGAVEAVGRTRPRVSPRWLGAVAASVCVVLVSAVLARGIRDEPYPREDVRGFIEEVSADLGPDDVALVYPATRWAWAVYSADAFAPRIDRASPTGFDVTIMRSGVEVLRPHRDHPERYAPEIEAAVRGRTRVVFVASHWGADIGAVEAWFLSNEWTEVAREESDGGRRVEFTKA
jgi:hypothetical protein